jgi:hypothetical protein
MHRIVVGLASLVFCVAFASADEKPKPTALPPHKLDVGFEKASTEKAINDALLNNELYKKAVKEALKAKTAQDAKFKENPKLQDASPAQAARQEFLEVLRDEIMVDNQAGLHTKLKKCRWRWAFN